MVFKKLRGALRKRSRERRVQKESFKVLVSKEKEKFRVEKVRKRAREVARAPSFGDFLRGETQRGVRKVSVRRRRRRTARKKQPQRRTASFLEIPTPKRRKQKPIKFF